MFAVWTLAKQKTSVVGNKLFYPLHPFIMRYRITYSIYYIEAESQEDAKNRVVDIVRSSAHHFVSAELPKPRRPLWKQLLLGR